jgi:alpha-beta hydrolase superfamily lysophospholipase
VKTSTFTHTASDGKEIFVRKWLPAGAPKGILIVAHGMAEHSERYGRFAAAMAPSGWAVYIPDHRGHGQTAVQGELGWLAKKNGFLRIRDDLHEIALVAQAECGTLPTFLLGHSMGSLLAETYFAAYGKELSGCLLSGVIAPAPPLFTAAGLLITAIGSAFKGQRTPSKLLHSMSFSANNKDFEPARTGVDWLSRDTAEVDKYVADPLCGFVCSFGFYRDMLSAFRSIYGKASAFAGLPKGLPVYILAGAEDPIGGAQGFVPILAEKLKAAGLEAVETRLYPGARHEILNETNRDEVTKDIKDWLDSNLAKARP